MTRGYIVGGLNRIESTDARDRNVGPGASEETILAAEEALGLRLPPSYRAFLKAFGYGGAGDTYLLGVCDSFELREPSFPNVVGINLAGRKSGLPDHVLVIEERDGGGQYALDFSTCDQSGETAVVVWPSEACDPKKPLEVVAVDFGEFLLARTAQLVEAPLPA